MNPTPRPTARLRDEKGLIATLTEESGLWRWTGDDPDIVETLNLLLETCDRSPSLGNWVIAHANRMAGIFAGTAEFEGFADPPPGRVY
jgi:hypothetical protein